MPWKRRGRSGIRTSRWVDFRKRWLALLTTSTLVKGTTFAKTIEGRWKSWWPGTLGEDQAQTGLAKLREERRKLLDRRVERGSEETYRNRSRRSKQLTRLDHEIDLGELERRVREYEAQPWLRKTGKERSQMQDAAFSLAFNAFFLVSMEAQNERLARIYAIWPKPLPLPVSGSQHPDFDARRGLHRRHSGRTFGPAGPDERPGAGRRCVAANRCHGEFIARCVQCRV